MHSDSASREDWMKIRSLQEVFFRDGLPGGMSGSMSGSIGPFPAGPGNISRKHFYLQSFATAPVGL
jgi:hypothetical protein